MRTQCSALARTWALHSLEPGLQNPECGALTILKAITLELIHKDLLLCRVPEGNIHSHPKEGHWKFQRGGGATSAKIYKGNFQRGGSVLT